MTTKKLPNKDEIRADLDAAGKLTGLRPDRCEWIAAELERYIALEEWKRKLSSPAPRPASVPAPHSYRSER